jgi:hypothetical protein
MDAGAMGNFELESAALAKSVEQHSSDAPDEHAPVGWHFDGDA